MTRKFLSCSMHSQVTKAFIILIVCAVTFNPLFNCNSPKSLNIVLLSGSNEYFSNISLEKYREYLIAKGMQVDLLKAGGELNRRDEYSEFTGLEVLDKADVTVLFLRRTSIDGDQLEQIKKYVNSGRGIVVLRTSCHGFLNWPEFDAEVLGGNYHGHYGGSPEKWELDENGQRSPVGEPQGPVIEIGIVQGAEKHEIMAGINNFTSKYSLYKVSPVASDVQVLMTGTIPDVEPEPVVWTRQYQGTRVAFIAQGGLQDWDDPIFLKLVTNSILWAAKKESK